VSYGEFLRLIAEIKRHSRFQEERMTTKSPNPSDTGSIFASSEVAERWQRGKALRDEINAPANEMMLDLANLRSGSRVLDVAAGTGDQTLLAARRVGSAGYVLATDLSANMLNLAAEAARKAGLDHVDTRVMDAENLDLDADSFDAVICRMGLMLFSNPVNALRGMHRAVKPTGKVVCLVWSSEDKNPCRGVPLTIFRRFGADFSVAPGLRLMFALGAPGILEKTFRASGFLDVAVHTVPTRWRFASPAEVIRLTKNSFPGLERITAQLSDADRERALKEIGRELSQFEDPNGFEAPGEVLIGVGTK
jgi:ubiquinone/menaquinone biosynthesis C-methylase UbiE